MKANHPWRRLKKKPDRAQVARIKYHNDPLFNAACKQRGNDHYEGHRDEINTDLRMKYATDPEYREKCLAQKRRAYAEKRARAKGRDET